MGHQDRTEMQTFDAKCADCRAGEHEDYDDQVELVTVRDPDTGRIVRKKLCAEHQAAYLDDGYTVT